MRSVLSSLVLLPLVAALAGCPQSVGSHPADAGDGKGDGGGILPPIRDGGTPPAPTDGGGGKNDAGGGGGPTDAGGGDPVDAGGGVDPVDAGGGGTPSEDAGIGPALCGNERTEPGEACDGAELGGYTCRDLGFAGGSLSCKSTCLDFDAEACTPLSATPIAQPGNTIQLSGSLDATDPSWARPTEDCQAGFSAGQHFEALAIVNETGALQSLNVTASWAGDGFLHVFRAPFKALDPVTGCVTGNDDLDGLIDQSGFVALSIPPGATLVLVASAYEADDPIGAFTVTVETVGETGTCGNGTLEAGEICDGAALGDATCTSRGFDGGALACSADCLSYDETACVNDPPPVATPIAQPGGTISLSGALDDTDPLWARPNATCDAATGGADRFYEAHSIVNNTGAAQLIRVTATWAGDGYVHVFRAPFDAAAPTTNCIKGDDDFNGLNGSQVEDVAIAAGETLVVVASAFSANAAIGAYSLEVLTQQPAVCGNDTREQSEVCDGADLESESCFSQGFSGGALACEATCGAFATRDCFTFAAPVNIAAPGGAVTLSGSLDANDPRWTRPGETCAASTDSGRLFDAFQIANNTGQTQSITLTASWGDDGFLHVFNNAFNSVAPTAGCLAGDDDFGGVSGSQIVEFDIFAGETLVVVASTYGTAATGGYTVEVATEQGPVCGNNIVEAGEVCDGSALGGESCAGLGRSGGILACNACAFETRDCFDMASALPIASPGNSVELTGALATTDPRWDRPTESCGGTPGDVNHHFDAFRIVNNTGAAQEIEVTASWAGDGFLHAFSAGFDSAAPRSGCLTGDDDFNTSAQSQIAALPIAAGQTLVLVASTFGTDVGIGDYTIRVRTKSDALPIGSPGTAIQLSGSIDTTDSKWNRLSATCVSQNNPDRHFDVHRIVNETGSVQDLTITANWSDGDGYLHLVTTRFDPASPDVLECLSGDDDFGVASATRGSRIESAAADNSDSVYILPGEELLVIASAFAANTAIGAYTIEVFTGSTDASPPQAAAIAPPGQSIETTGTLHVTDAQWDRPTNCDAPAGGTADHYFDAHYIENTSSSTKDVRITATWAGGDGYLQVYLGDLFNPTSPGLCLASNDDFGGSGQSQVEEFLLAGETITVVASTFNGATAIGAYSLVVETLP